MFKFQYQSGKKRKNWEKFSGLQNRPMRALQIGAGVRDCKSRLDGLQIGTALGISNRGRDFKSRQGLQIGVE